MTALELTTRQQGLIKSVQEILEHEHHASLDVQRKKEAVRSHHGNKTCVICTHWRNGWGGVVPSGHIIEHADKSLYGSDPTKWCLH